MKLTAAELQEIVDRDLGSQYRVALGTADGRLPDADVRASVSTGVPATARGALPGSEEASGEAGDIAIIRVERSAAHDGVMEDALAVVVSTSLRRVIGVQG